MQVGEPGRGRRERPDAEQTAVGVERGGDVDIQMGVDSAGDRTRLYDGHRHPFSVQLGQGVARTSREGDRDDRTALTDRSITLRNGACPYPTHGPADRHLHILDVPTSQTGPQKPLTVAHHPHEPVDHHQTHHHPHWARRLYAVLRLAVDPADAADRKRDWAG